ncbi:MAG: PSD1 and planctomycete cytochrome C domain-containing protein [Pirellulales bacterium]
MRLSFSRWWVLYCIAVVFAASPIAVRAETTAEEEQWFERSVRPVLAAHCGECHGAERQESGLRLDTRAGLMQGGNRGAVVNADQPLASLLLHAVEYQDAELQMPPDGRLPAESIDVLRQWVERGTPWPGDRAESEPPKALDVAVSGHWAFQPVSSQPAVPEARSPAGDKVSSHPIDVVVDRRLAEAGWQRSSPADPRTLVRRAYRDLWGLPPTYEDVERFAADPSDSAWERLVDRLLADPRYGEHWGRHWLDVARYADTKGYVDGGQPEYAFAYTYRDYVIRALNEDLPYADFVRDQLAADQLSLGPSQQWRLAGLGFLTVGRRFNFNRHDTRDDQIDAVARGLLGLTASCARCHDHKYDPISSADYYSMYGLFASMIEPGYADLPLMESEPAGEAYQQHLGELRDKQEAYDKFCLDLSDKIQLEMRQFASDYLVYVVQESAQHREGPQNPLKTDRTILRGPTAYGSGAIVRWRDYIAARPDDDRLFGLWKAMWSVEKSEFAESWRKYLDEHPEANELLAADCREVDPKSMVELARVYGGLFERVDGARREQVPAAKSEGKDPVKVLAESTDSPLRAGEESVLQTLYGPGSPTVMTDEDFIECYSLGEHVDVRNKWGEMESVAVKFEGGPGRAMVVRGVAHPYEPRIFVRGEPRRPGRPVERGNPELLKRFVSIDESLQGSRLGLAEAIVDPQNPLTARVLVNRVWGWHFGTPLVDTPSDFGVRTERPLQLELLDVLADYLVRHDWSLKQLHRWIMTSETYRQSSRWREPGERDPENRYLWRYPPHRADWETIRDSLLAVSGELQPRLNARPVAKGPEDPSAVCRTIYLKLDRQQLPSAALAFDFPSPDLSVSRRNVTQVPQQQLFFLNSPLVMRQAERLAQRCWQAEPHDEAGRINYLFRAVLARDAESVELEAVATWLRNERGTGPGDKPNEAETDSTDTIWTQLAHALLQSSELVWID